MIFSINIPIVGGRKEGDLPDLTTCNDLCPRRCMGVPDVSDGCDTWPGGAMSDGLEARIQ